jgi:hypothetical protein
MRIRMMALLLFTLALSAAVLLGTPRTASACGCISQGGTSEYTGSGASCAEAAGDWHQQASAEASADCGQDPVCGSHYVVTVSCQLDTSTGLYEETGYKGFGCLICV